MLYGKHLETTLSVGADDTLMDKLVFVEVLGLNP